MQGLHSEIIFVHSEAKINHWEKYLRHSWRCWLFLRESQFNWIEAFNIGQTFIHYCEIFASRKTSQLNCTNMSINVQTPGIHHIALRCTNLERSKAFYNGTLGFPIALEVPNLFIFVAGGTFIGVRGPADQEGVTVFNPFNVGIDHLALGCTDEAELQRVAKGLADAGVENTGVKFDETLGKNYIAFKDPDRIAWEFYMV
jgi:catechol 2,3-dioxygenase-like lactoylglutathione lyase family enzyme